MLGNTPDPAQAPESPDRHSRPPAFDRLRTAIAAAEGQRKTLTAFLEHITPLECFDDTDRDTVSQHLLKAVDEEQRLRTMLRQRQHVYETQLRGLQRDLASRDKVLRDLADQSAAFDEFPEITAHFAQRHHALLQRVEQLTASLESDWD